MGTSEIIFGRYRIIERVGEGGMCHVFRALSQDDSEVALKILKDEFKDDPRFRTMFTTEAEVTMALDHTNLIRGFDSGEHMGRLFLAIELVEGCSLDELVESAHRRGFPIPPDLALYIVSEVLDGLHALHETTSSGGVPLMLVHRDVSPDNIFLAFDGRVVLGDFGVAQIQDIGASVVPLGKLGYMAPEMVQGGDLDRRADVFSAGVILYELITGARAFPAETDEEGLALLAEAKVQRPSRMRPDIDRNLEELMLKALARRPQGRFQTAEEMLVELGSTWSQVLGNPRSLEALLAAMRPKEAKAWATRHRPETKSTLDIVWPTS